MSGLRHTFTLKQAISFHYWTCKCMYFIWNSRVSSPCPWPCVFFKCWPVMGNLYGARGQFRWLQQCLFEACAASMNHSKSTPPLLKRFQCIFHQLLGDHVCLQASEACECPLNESISVFRRSAPQADAYIVFILFTVDGPTKSPLFIVCSLTSEDGNSSCMRYGASDLVSMQLIHHLQGLSGFEWGVKPGQARFLLLSMSPRRAAWVCVGSDETALILFSSCSFSLHPEMQTRLLFHSFKDLL